MSNRGNRSSEFLSFLLFYFVIFVKFRSTLTDVPWCNGNTYYTKGISMENSITRFSKFMSTRQHQNTYHKQQAKF